MLHENCIKILDCPILDKEDIIKFHGSAGNAEKFIVYRLLLDLSQKLNQIDNSLQTLTLRITELTLSMKNRDKK